MENEKGISRISRKRLYDEIWELSVAGVARKYNLNYAKLIASCKEANIPFPPSGYWTRRNLGKDVSAEVIPLTGSDNEMVELIPSSHTEQRINKGNRLDGVAISNVLPFWTKRKRKLC